MMHMPLRVGLPATMAALLASGVASADPEAGGAVSQTTGLVAITSASAAAPTILRSARVRCPAAGLLIADAEAGFQMGIGGPLGTPGVLDFGISRTAAFDVGVDHPIELTNQGVFLSVPGSIQRFDRCKGGQTVTYNFNAWQHANLSGATAIQPRLSVIFLRDSD